MAREQSSYWATLTADGDGMTQVTVRDTHGLDIDEPEWSSFGHDRAPCPMDYLLVGVAGCQVQTLCHCLERSRLDDYEIDTTVEGRFQATDCSDGIPDPAENRLTDIAVEISITVESADERRVRRCLDVVGNDCVVTRSIRDGVSVSISTSMEID